MSYNQTRENDRPSRFTRCVSCLRRETQTGIQLEIGPNGNHTICDECYDEGHSDE